MKLLIHAAVKLIVGLGSIGAVLFLSAGTLQYQNGWLLMGVLSLSMLILVIALFVKAPDLLSKRLDIKEKDPAQKGIVRWVGVGLVAELVLAGLDARFAWTLVPLPIVMAGVALFLLGGVLYALVLRQNAWLSRAVRVQDGQQVVDSGVYGLVRHPMYTATILLYGGMIAMLGSWIALIAFCHYPVFMARRACKEEALLCQELEGYREYTQKVKYRLIPFVW